jgi:hypothetical protein
MKHRVFRAVLALTMLIGLMLGITSTAAAGAGGYWTDPGNYDTSWYADPGASS